MSTLAMVFDRAAKPECDRDDLAQRLRHCRGLTADIGEAAPGKILQNQLTYPLEYPNEY